MQLWEIKNQRKVTEHNPTLLATVNGYTFHEHPIKGEDAPLIVRDLHDGTWYFSDFWDVPSTLELTDYEEHLTITKAER